MTRAPSIAHCVCAGSSERGARGKTAAISFLPIYLYNGGLAPNRRADKFKVLRQTRVLNCDMQSPRQPKPLYKATQRLRHRRHHPP